MLPKVLNKENSLFGHIIKLGLIIFFVVFMVTNPKEVFAASKTGLDAWLKIVFPALLPFFIGSELLMSYGMVRFMGVLLEPVMRPIFNLPGAGSFVMAVGFTSGFPISSVLTAKLKREGVCTRNEAERLMSFTNNASPLFMLGAVAVGMFNNPRIGYIIAGAHYLANLTIGIMLRFYGREHNVPVTCQSSERHIFRRAIDEFRFAKISEKRAFGQILGDAIKNSVNTLLLIGGFVIIFAVIIRIMEITGFAGALTKVISLIMNNFGFPQSIDSALASGFWEITVGTKITSLATSPLIYKLMAVSFILGWSGLSVHAQVASVISNTNIRMRIFVISRFVQGVLAAIYCYFFAGPAFKVVETLTVPVFKQISPYIHPTWWQVAGFSSILFVKITLFLVSLGILVGFLKETRVLIIKHK